MFACRLEHYLRDSYDSGYLLDMDFNCRLAQTIYLASSLAVMLPALGPQWCMKTSMIELPKHHSRNSIRPRNHRNHRKQSTHRPQAHQMCGFRSNVKPKALRKYCSSIRLQPRKVSCNFTLRRSLRQIMILLKKLGQRRNSHTRKAASKLQHTM